MTAGGGFVCVSDVSRALVVTPRAVQKRAKSENWPYRVKNRRGDKEFEIAGLPEDVRAAISNRGQEGRGMERVDPGYNIRIARRVPKAAGSPELTDRQNKIALARADLIREYLKEKQAGKNNGRGKGRACNEFIQGYNTGVLMPGVFAVLGKVSKQSAERWAKSFRDSDFDFISLAPRWGNRRGQRKITEHEYNTLLSFALTPERLRIEQAVRLTKKALEKRGLTSPSSGATLRRALEDFQKNHYDTWVFAREGEKALNDKVLPYMERDGGLLDVGDVLVADGHVLNFQVIHPFHGKPCRASMVLWYDWASRFPAGWEIMPTEDVQCVAAGLRRAIIALGKMPRVAYLDNGKAFKARVFTSQNIDFEQTGFYGMFARLGIETVFAWPYHAQSKNVERFFGTFGELERLMPTYTGRSIEDKPAWTKRDEKLHKKMHLKRYGGWVPTIEEADTIIAGWVSEYAARPHRGLKGLCPGDIFMAGRGDGVDETALRHLMMSVEVKAVTRSGVRLMGRNYYDEALYGYRGRVTVRYDLEDMSRVLVYDETGGKLICEAGAARPVHPVARVLGSKDDLAAVKEGIKQKRALKRATEASARAWVEDAPALVEIPPGPPLQKGGEARAGLQKGGKPLPRGEAERIEAEAGAMQVLELRPKKQDVYVSESDRYEALLERECRSDTLAVDDMSWMRWFETTDLYSSLQDRFEFLREQWIAGPEENEGSGL